MCDTMAVVPPASAGGAVWFGKNADREAGEAHVVEHRPARRHPPRTVVRCTHLEIPQAAETHEVLFCRPVWGWGAEMGVNGRGVAIGNEAVFTRLPVPREGLTGLDLVRLALERAATAREAVELIGWFLARHEQGGRHGYRNTSFRYHNSFLIADAAEAWVLETAGRFWAAERVRGTRTISNVLSIGGEPDLLSPDAYPFARSKGWCRSAADFHFARCFGSPAYRVLTGGARRQACTAALLGGGEGAGGTIGRDRLLSALRDHAGLEPAAGWRMEMPCAHASWWPTRRAGQTTASLVARLGAKGPGVWLTGTSSPCLSVYKPAALGGEPLRSGPAPGPGYDAGSLFWRHERLHRLVLPAYGERRALIEDDRRALEARSLEVPPEAAAASAIADLWEEHRTLLPEWAARVERAWRPVRRFGPFSWYWSRENRREAIPAPARA